MKIVSQPEFGREVYIVCWRTPVICPNLKKTIITRFQAFKILIANKMNILVFYATDEKIIIFTGI